MLQSEHGRPSTRAWIESTSILTNGCTYFRIYSNYVYIWWFLPTTPYLLCVWLCHPTCHISTKQICCANISHTLFLGHIHSLHIFLLHSLFILCEICILYVYSIRIDGLLFEFIAINSNCWWYYFVQYSKLFIFRFNGSIHNHDSINNQPCRTQLLQTIFCSYTSSHIDLVKFMPPFFERDNKKNNVQPELPLFTMHNHQKKWKIYSMTMSYILDTRMFFALFLFRTLALKPNPYLSHFRSKYQLHRHLSFINYKKAVLGRMNFFWKIYYQIVSTFFVMQFTSTFFTKTSHSSAPEYA